MKEPYLLTPGPLTTSLSVKQAMLQDWGSRDSAFIEMNRAVRARLLQLANATGSHVCVPIQGSGSFAVESTIGTLLPPGGKLLVLVNGAYGQRMVQMARVMGRAVDLIEWAENEPVDPVRLDRHLARDAAVTHVAVVHCETTSGILNPVEAVAQTVARHGRALLIDAMSAFGALAIDATLTPFTALMASSNKCLEGVPGMGFAIIDKAALADAKGNAHSLSLDLYAQWQGFEANAQWRFTPPTHVVAAFHQALAEHEEEGGVEGRGNRYRDNHRILVDGMERLGFETLLSFDQQAPVIVTFRMPKDPAFVFETFYDKLRGQGFVIYPGKLTVAPSFRVGCIGRLGGVEMTAFIAAAEAVLADMGVRSGASE